jgi:diguanylate cyclase (GGDEF)-like protein
MHIPTQNLSKRRDIERRKSASSKMSSSRIGTLILCLVVASAVVAALLAHRSVMGFAEAWAALLGLAWMPASGIMLHRYYLAAKANAVDEGSLQAQRQVELFRATRRDSLTGLPSRPVFAEMLSGIVGAERPAALLVVDIDRFNEINSVYGDSTGDDLLRAVADRLRTIAGQREHVGRMDGDEFALVVEKPEELKRLGETVTQILQQLTAPYPAGGILLDMTVSLGVARAPEHGTSADTLLRAGRLALQTAKSAGGGTWRRCGNEESEQLRRRAQIRDELSQAIENGQIIPWYQPIVSLPDGMIAKFEVLARWQHPKLGILEPDVFIPLAEELGLSGYLSMALLRSVALDLVEWPSWCRFAINASAGQLRELINFVRNQPGDWQRRMDLSRLDVEVTETALIRDRNMVRELIDVLHEHGARAGLDNFGSGYSNFFHLRELPFDTIKIGKSFISEMLIDPRAESCVLAMIWLGHGLGIDMVADGVENGAIAERLAKMGCHFAQGYHYAHPVPAEEVAGLLKESEQKAKQMMTAQG